MNNMNNIASAPVIECQHVGKTFMDGGLYVEVLQDISLAVQPGEQIAIVGASGSGKSTLLHLMGGLDAPSHGQVLIAGHDVNHLSERKRSHLRNQTLGFVYQFHHLLPEFTVLENVCMPLLVRGVAPECAIEKARVLLRKVDILRREKHKLSELSGGERQRTAIARALVTDPACILADEPTGNLDHWTADRVYNTMLDLNRDLKTSIIIVTHDPRLGQRMDRVLTIEEGCLRQMK